MYDYTIVGGGIVGLATAAALMKLYPKCKVLVLEKEDQFAKHQTGRNSGVIHSGIYYAPGTAKAQLARSGNASLRAFCERHCVPYQACGKLIVATDERELPRLEQLYQRALQNQIPVKRLSPEQVREYEPHVFCIAAILVHSTAITDYRAVCDALLRELRNSGADLRLCTRMLSSVHDARCHHIETTSGTIESGCMIACAGLHSDRVAALSGAAPNMKIVPFRGEYFVLRPEKQYLVNGLIYPVPDPRFPFLGVHLTRTIDGSILAGPNAVLALKREGYSKTSFSLQDALDTFSYPGFWKLASHDFGAGFSEMRRSASKRLFAQSLQRLIPELTADDLAPGPAGVRAQALRADGILLDDFYILKSATSIHVLNAPSPAATASLEIGMHIATQAAPPASTSVAVGASAK